MVFFNKKYLVRKDNCFFLIKFLILLFLISHNPVFISLILVSTFLFYSIFMSIFLAKTWLLFMVVLLYVSGVFVITLYLSAVSKNLSNFLFFEYIFMFLFYSTPYFLSKITFNKTFMGYFFIISNFMFVVMLMMIIFLTMLFISFFFSFMKEPIRSL